MITRKKWRNLIPAGVLVAIISGFAASAGAESSVVSSGDPDCERQTTGPTAGTKVSQPTAVQQKKLWQPRGGDLELTVQSQKTLLSNEKVVVCFRWKKDEAKAAKDSKDYQYVRADVTNVELTNASVLKISTVVPNALGEPNAQGFAPVQKTSILVPVAEARIIVLDPKDSNNPLIDATTTIGVTYVSHGVITTAVSLILAFLALWAVKAHRPKMIFSSAGKSKQPRRIDTFLGLISTSRGYASLSQFQVVIWTFVVGACVVYVMSLSGTLIEPSIGTLALLGISGATVITSKLKSDTDDEANPQGGNVIAAQQPRAPRWSDLVINEKWEKGVLKAREIDVTRVQMLYFTVIAAVFVVISVVTNYVIPDIQQNFLLLMGISNGVYLTAKYTQR